MDYDDNNHLHNHGVLGICIYPGQYMVGTAYRQPIRTIDFHLPFPFRYPSSYRNRSQISSGAIPCFLRSQKFRH